MSPTNLKEWFDLLDDAWEDVRNIVLTKMDSEHPAYETPGDATSPATGRTIAGELDYLKSQRTPDAGHKLARYLNATWAMSSDAYAWSVPGWGELCDLCSEEWALDTPAPKVDA